jgi:hypothetical protein
MSLWGALGTLPLAEVETGSLGAALPPPSFSVATQSGPPVLIADIEIYKPAAATEQQGAALGELALGEIASGTAALPDSEIIRASDAGYVTRPDDPGGLRVYPPILLSAIEADRALDLTPDGIGAGAGWGSIRLSDDDGALALHVVTRNADSRPFAIRMGRRAPLPHGIFRDPAWAETAILLAGVGAEWVHDTDSIVLRLRDPTHWLDRRVEGTAYAGSGGLEGGADLEGKRKPRLRGGTAGNPVREVAPTLVNATSGIYQVSDAPGAIVTLYERGLSGGITSAGTVPDIEAASPSAATYVVESSARGLFIRLGTFPPAGQITVDAWGSMPDATSPSTPGDLALAMLLQDFAVPSQYLDAGSFTGLAAAFPYPCGWHLGAGEDADGAALVGLLMRSAGARLVPGRNGTLQAIALRGLAAGWIPAASYGPETLLRCEARPLGAPLSPPPYRMRVGYQRFHTTQVSDLAPTLSGARRQALAEPWRIAAASSSDVLAAWRRPSDPALVETALTSETGAQALADVLRDLWCIAGGRRAYDITLPLAYALRHDIGEAIYVRWPGPLADGALARIVGEQVRTADDTATIQVLV